MANFDTAPRHETDIQFLKTLQQELKTQDHDCQAAPRFWVIMDYKIVPTNETYNSDRIQYFHNDGEWTFFENVHDLKEFFDEHFDEEVEHDDNLYNLLNQGDFGEAWDYIHSNYNMYGYFDVMFMEEQEFIVPDTMFLTKNDAINHLKLNKHHYTAKAHTYAMTAWRSPTVAKLLRVLATFDFGNIYTDQIIQEKGVD